MLAYGELSETERLWDGFAAGQPVDLRPAGAVLEDPRDGVAWGDERTVRAEALRAVLTSGGSGSLNLAGARISGPLDLSDTSVTLRGCHFDRPVTVRASRSCALPA